MQEDWINALLGALVSLGCLADFVSLALSVLSCHSWAVLTQYCGLSINRIRVIQIPVIYSKYKMYVKSMARSATRAFACVRCSGAWLYL